jgi:hypothetical protein
MGFDVTQLAKKQHSSGKSLQFDSCRSEAAKCLMVDLSVM